MKKIEWGTISVDASRLILLKINTVVHRHELYSLHVCDYRVPSNITRTKQELLYFLKQALITEEKYNMLLAYKLYSDMVSRLHIIYGSDGLYLQKQR